MNHETVAQFLDHVRPLQALRKSVTLPSLQQIRESLDRFTPPDFTYKATPNEFSHLDEAMSDEEAFDILTAIAEHIATRRNDRLTPTLARIDPDEPLLRAVDRLMVGMWLEHERIPVELIQKSARYLGIHGLSVN